jgi:phage regulator Rha-like protein
MSAAKTDALAGGAAQGIEEEEQTSADPVQCSSSASDGGQAFELVACKEECRADSRLLAQHLGIGHRPVMALIDRYADKFKVAGKLLFKKASSAKGQAIRFALLNEDQANFLLSLTRNTQRTVSLKLKLTQAFGEYRRAAEMHKAEYLPGYHGLHDRVSLLAAGSVNCARVHQNINQLVNKVAGLESGQRGGASLPQKALLIVTQSVVAAAMRGAHDHHDGYQMAKRAALALAALTQIESTTAAMAPTTAPAQASTESAA